MADETVVQASVTSSTATLSQLGGFLGLPSNLDIRLLVHKNPSQ